MTRARAAPWRSFDPRRVGAYECRAWVAYYRREWLVLLAVSVALVHAGFRMRPWRTLHSAWLILRANQRWAPADADAGGARRCMERFYRLLARDSGERLDTVEAARLEIEWWRAHRAGEHERLVGALTDLYAFLYGNDPAEVRPAAALRAEAMGVSDRWVTEGCHAESPLVDEERALLIRSYASLLSAVHRPRP